MRTEKEFPRTFCSSSAAYRAIRQFEEKNQCVESSGLIMTKVDKKVFVVSRTVSIDLKSFNETHPNVSYNGVTYRYFQDGILGAGYYELKTGDRRRPNSLFLSSETVFTDLVSERCKL